MGWKLYMLAILITGSVACQRTDMETINSSELAAQLSVDTINQIDPNTVDLKSRAEEPNKGGFNFWILISCVSIAINLLLIYFIVWLNRNYKKDIRDLKQQYSQKLNLKSNQFPDPTPLSTETKQLEPTDSNALSSKDHSTSDEESDEEDKKIEVELQIENHNIQEENSNHVEEPMVLYAGKVSESGEFSDVSQNLDPHKSYFKIISDSLTQSEAEFEVLDSPFILTQASNAPEIYLYNACDPENSNQNFNSEIVTINRGIAQLVNGTWQVKRGNKAKIKFQ